VPGSAIQLIGAPFDGFGREGHQARAADALRRAGLDAGFGEREVRRADVALPPPDPGRAAASGMMNEAALLELVDALHARVSDALATDRFPIIHGGECSVLLGAVSGLRDHHGVAGLVLVDGHEDTTPLDASPDGEAANMEVGLLLGITGQLAPARLRRRLPVLETAALAMLGPRDHELRRTLNVASLADRGVFFRDDDAVAADPSRAAVDAVEHVRRSAPAWWLHTDLDVLAQDVFTAGRVPDDEDEPGGLDWAQLTELTSAALGCRGCAGWSIVIYDPEQDADGGEARRIVQFVADVAARAL
jgi:arginase